MSERELTEWLQFYRLEPWGPERFEYPIATLTALTANINRDSKKRVEPYTAKDFLIQWAPTPEPDEDELPGLAPAHVMNVMETLMRHQAQVEKQRLRAR